MSVETPHPHCIIVSLRELVVLVRRVLFSLRIPVYAALSASRLIAQLELREGNGLAYLEALVSLRLRWQVGRRQVHVEQEVTWVDAEDDHVLLLGPSLVDVACAKAKRQGIGMVLAQSVGTLPFAMALDELGARRGFSTLVAMGQPGSLCSVLKGRADIAIAGEESSTEDTVVFGVVCAASNSEGVAVSQKIKSATPIDIVRDWLAVPKPCDEIRLISDWPALNERGDLLIVCQRQHDLPSVPVSTEWGRERGYEWVLFGSSTDGAATWWERQAVKQGVQVNESLWNCLEEQVFRGLAPKSSRSRQDAGAAPGLGEHS